MYNHSSNEHYTDMSIRITRAFISTPDYLYLSTFLFSNTRTYIKYSIPILGLYDSISCTLRDIDSQSLIKLMILVSESLD